MPCHSDLHENIASSSPSQTTSVTEVVRFTVRTQRFPFSARYGRMRPRARARTDNIAIFIISVSLMSRQRSKTTQCTRMIGGYKNWNNSEAQASDPNKFLRALDAIISIYVISVPTLTPAKQHSRAQTTNSRLSYHFFYSNKRHNSEIQSVFPKCRMHRQRAARNLLLFGKRLMYRSIRA